MKLKIISPKKTSDANGSLALVRGSEVYVNDEKLLNVFRVSVELVADTFIVTIKVEQFTKDDQDRYQLDENRKILTTTRVFAPTSLSDFEFDVVELN